MSYVDIFNKKLAIFTDELAIKGRDNAVRLKKSDGHMPWGNWVEG